MFNTLTARRGATQLKPTTLLCAVTTLSVIYANYCKYPKNVADSSKQFLSKYKQSVSRVTCIFFFRATILVNKDV